MQQTRDSIQGIWGERAGYVGSWPARVDQRTTEEPERWVPSACVLCSNGCGLDIGVKGGRMVGVRGRADDRVSRGRLGPKGLHGWEANASPNRLTTPLIRRNGRLEEATWDEAMELIVARSQQLVRERTAGAMAFIPWGNYLWKNTIHWRLLVKLAWARRTWTATKENAPQTLAVAD